MEWKGSIEDLEDVNIGVVIMECIMDVRSEQVVSRWDWTGFEGA